ncbi:uncharacterized protein [Penaeus vannamei]|uniref:uncharacterized protein n=1 Tax=Penaeus vannamei TaxID=6689 RepID=UPI00387F4031
MLLNTHSSLHFLIHTFPASSRLVFWRQRHVAPQARFTMQMAVPASGANRLLTTSRQIKPNIERVLSETQTGFRKDRSTVEQILNLRTVCKENRNHQTKVYHNFIDFKKAFDRVLHDALWHTMRNEWFKSTVGVRQGCILSPTLFKFLERIMQDALADVEGGTKCSGLVINNLRFADDIDLIANNPDELKE